MKLNHETDNTLNIISYLNLKFSAKIICVRKCIEIYKHKDFKAINYFFWIWQNNSAIPQFQSEKELSKKSGFANHCTMYRNKILFHYYQI